VLDHAVRVGERQLGLDAAEDARDLAVGELAGFVA
jgi:hypothetical protein